jgi:hypothetical protein
MTFISTIFAGVLVDLTLSSRCKNKQGIIPEESKMGKQDKKRRMHTKEFKAEAVALA